MTTRVFHRAALLLTFMLIPLLTHAAEKSSTTAFIYIGKNAPHKSVLDVGVKMRAAPSPTAAEVGRLSSGTKFDVLEYVDHFDGTNSHYIWAKIKRADAAGHPVTHKIVSLETEMKNVHRCGCASNTMLNMHVIDDAEKSILECDRCGATWPLLADRMRTLDFRPIGGPLVATVLPDSYPAALRLNC